MTLLCDWLKWHDCMSTPPVIRQPWPKTRQFTRQPLEGRLTIHVPTGKVRGWLHDISEDGVGGVVAVQLADGSEADVEFELEQDRPPLRVRANVRFSSGFRYGFEFVELDQAQRDAI